MKPIFLLAIIVFFAKTTLAQEPFFEKINTEQGIPSSEVYKIYQDHNGFIWIATDAGISKFDGVNMITYTTSDGIPENVVFDIYEDVHGRLWFSCMSGNFFFFENDKFYSIGANEKLKEFCKQGHIKFFFVGKGDTLYCSVFPFLGILKIPPTDNYEHLITERITQKCNYLIYQNELRKSELLFVVLAPQYLSPPDSINYLQIHNSSKLFIGASAPITINTVASSDGDSLIFMGKSNRLTILNYITGKVVEYSFKSDARILAIKQDKNKNLWLGTTRGAWQFKESDIKRPPNHYLNNIQISSIMLDLENNLWLGSLQKGLFISHNTSLYDINAENDYPSNFQREKDCIYVFFNSKKVIKFDTNFCQTNIYTAEKYLPKLENLNYGFIKRDYAYYGMVSKFYYMNNKKRNYFVDNEKHDIGLKDVIDLGNDTCILVGVNKFFLFKRTKVIAKEIAYPFSIKCLKRLRNNAIIIGSRSNFGIYVLNGRNWIPFLPNYPQLKTRVNDIEQDSFGNLWIATNEKGVFCISNNEIKEFTTKSGLCSNKINDIDIDSNNNVWLATNRGINKIELTKNITRSKIYSFNKSHGLPNVEIESVKFFQNNIFCHSREHLFYINKDSIQLNSNSPSVYLTLVTVNSMASNSVSNNSKLEYDQNNVEFAFTSTTFKRLWKHEFIFRLKGYENNWQHSEIGKKEYTNLPSGSYSFEVYALNNDGVKSLKPATFSFSIDKPFWLKWWFVLLEIITGMSLIILFIRWRINKIKKVEEEKTRLNKKVSEFQMTALRAQMNPHFIFNVISSIQHYILKSDVYQSYNYLAKFAKIIRNILDTSKEEFITIKDEIDALSLYIDLEKVRFREPFESVVEIDPELDQEAVLIPTMIIQPYVENAIWHGLMAKQETGRLLIAFVKQGEFLKITIEDNGVGINEAVKKRGTKHISKGLELTKMRLRTLAENSNSECTVEIIDLKSESIETQGTRIIIKIPIILD